MITDCLHTESTDETEVRKRLWRVNHPYNVRWDESCHPHAVCFFMLFLQVSEFIRIFAHGLRPDSVVPEIYNQLKGN